MSLTICHMFHISLALVNVNVTPVSAEVFAANPMYIVVNINYSIIHHLMNTLSIINILFTNIKDILS